MKKMVIHNTRNKHEDRVFNPFRTHRVVANKYKTAGVDPEVWLLDQISLDPYEKINRMFIQNRKGIEMVLIEEMKNELIDKLRNRGYTGDMIDVFFRNMDLKSFNDVVLKPTYHNVYTALTVPFFERSAHTVRDYQAFNIGALEMMQGLSESKDRLTYWKWPMRESILRRTENTAPYLYYTGEPGSGKSNAIDLGCMTGLQINYWVYTNRPLLPRRPSDHLYQIGRLSDLFVDSKTIPSIFRAQMWGDEHGINTGVLIALDERGMGEITGSRQGRMAMELGQIRRHFFMSIIEGGVRQKPPGLESDVTYLIGTHAEDLKETDKDGNPRKKFFWELVFREPREDEHGEEQKRVFVYDIPRCGLNHVLGNKYDLTNDFVFDMSMKAMLGGIGNTSRMDDNALLEVTRNYTRAGRTF